MLAYYAMLATVKGLASGYGRDLQQIKSSIWSTSKTSISTLLVLKSVLLTLRVNEKQMKKSAELGYLVALDVAEALVKNDIPFRTTHKIAGRLVQTAHGKKKQLSKLTSDDVSQAVRGSKVDPGLVMEVIRGTTVTSSLRARKSFGSSGYSEQDRMIDSRIKKINSCRTTTTNLDNNISQALGELASKVQELIR